MSVCAHPVERSSPNHKSKYVWPHSSWFIGTNSERKRITSEVLIKCGHISAEIADHNRRRVIWDFEFSNRQFSLHFLQNPFPEGKKMILLLPASARQRREKLCQSLS